MRHRLPERARPHVAHAVAFLLAADPGPALSTNEVQAARRHALRIVGAQIAVTLAAAVGCLIAAGVESGRSALIGGGIGVVTTAYMAFAVLRYGAGTDPQRIALGFLVGWVIKVLMTIALLVIAFRSDDVVPVPLVAAYVSTLATFWVVATWGSPRGVPRRKNDGRVNGSRSS